LNKASGIRGFEVPISYAATLHMSYAAFEFIDRVAWCYIGGIELRIPPIKCRFVRTRRIIISV